MTDRFSWQTDDEGNWVQPSVPPSRRHRWSLVLFACFVVFGLGYGIYRFSLRQIEQREQIVKTEIRAAHTTWLQAVDGQDLELLTMLSTRRDSEWYATQRRLLTSGRLLDRSVLGLSLSERPSAETEIVLSPDMAEAEMHFPEAYTVGDGSNELPIVLEQTAVYEKKGSTWAQRPLTDDEWGATRQVVSPRTVVTFPERDEAIVGRIASDLGRELGTVCGVSGDSRRVNVTVL